MYACLDVDAVDLVWFRAYGVTNVQGANRSDPPDVDASAKCFGPGSRD